MTPRPDINELFSWGMLRSSTSVRPSLRSRIEPSVLEVSCTKLTDGSSVALLTERPDCKFDRTVTLQSMREGTGGLMP